MPRADAPGRKRYFSLVTRSRRVVAFAAASVLGCVVIAGALAASGDLDKSFGSGGKVLTDFGSAGPDDAHAVAVQPDGKIVVAGYTRKNGTGDLDFALARYTTSGELDSSFGSGGIVETDLGSGSDDLAEAVAVRPDGKILVAGSTNPDPASNAWDFAVVRYTPSGTLDSTFGSGGVVTTDLGSNFDFAHAMALQPNGKIVVAGSSQKAGQHGYDFAVVRYTPSGALDRSFGSGGKVLTDLGPASDDEASAVALQQDGKIVVAGGTSKPGTCAGSSAPWTCPDFALVRYTTHGSLDTSFGSGGKVRTDLGSGSVDWALGVAVQPNGKIVAAGSRQLGSCAGPGNCSDIALVRYKRSGRLDRSFGSSGKVLTDISVSDEAAAVAVQKDGKIVAVGGTFTPGSPSGTTKIAIVRYRTSGALDTTFGSGGKVVTDLGTDLDEWAAAVALQKNGKIVVAGGASIDDGGNDDFLVACYSG